MYLERRILAELHGEAHRSFSAIIGWKALTNSIDRFGADHDFTKLVINLEGRDPDDAFSSVPYEKGSTFLLYLETLVGRQRWDSFIPHYFTSFARRSLDSFEFKKCLLDFFRKDPTATKQLQSVDWEVWLHQPGYPPKPDFDTSLVDVCYQLAEKWDPATSASGHVPREDDVKGWSANQMVVFLEKVEIFSHCLKHDDVLAMGQVYGCAHSQNVEVLSRYYQVAMRARVESINDLVVELLGRVGRMKFVRP